MVARADSFGQQTLKSVSEFGRFSQSSWTDSRNLLAFLPVHSASYIGLSS